MEVFLKKNGTISEKIPGEISLDKLFKKNPGVILKQILGESFKAIHANTM